MGAVLCLRKVVEGGGDSLVVVRISGELSTAVEDLAEAELGERLEGITDLRAVARVVRLIGAVMLEYFLGGMFCFDRYFLCVSLPV